MVRIQLIDVTPSHVPNHDLDFNQLLMSFVCRFVSFAVDQRVVNVGC